ncbi:hypothetical protein QX776_08780 [Alteromonadaceae bacterium BrNp21-10]|nr:hypothetical protein [Alteromonadaceae bacterium BrNp21-10]
MKTQLITAAVGVIAIGVISYFLLIDDPTKDFSEDQKNGWRLMKTAQTLCLAGDSLSISLDLQSDFTAGANASAGGNKQNLSGALGYMDEQIRSIQDEKIRDCLAEYMPDIKACMLNQCGSARLPKAVEFQFSYTPTIDNNFISHDLVYFGLQNRQNKRKLVKQNDGFYVDSIEFPDKGKTLNAIISPITVDGHIGNQSEIKFRLKQSANIDANPQPFTRYNCSPENGCQLDQLAPHLFDWEALVQHSPQSPLSLFAKAYAQDSKQHYWSIPSLENLQHNPAAQTLGYTTFTLQASSPLNIDADAYYYDIRVNGIYAYENGAPGEYRVQPYNADAPLKLTFGLQNLNFSGIDSGCDAISVELTFLKNQQPLPTKLLLQRSYVALRDAAEKKMVVGDVTWHWSGEYARADNDFDYEVFIISEQIDKHLNFDGKSADMLSAVGRLNKIKREFEATNTQFNGQPVVAVLRPPLTKVSYGLVAGLIQQNGQINFTLDKATAYALGDFLVAERNNNREIKRIVHPDKYIYKIRGSDEFMSSPPICPGEGII